jgi:demethylmenaquinone methyltransferase/2-methoxy-6-polyprenyl-1,4-benzoquinol methylase
MVLARAEALPFRDGCAGAALTGFTLRNVSDLPAAVSEMARVVRPGGKVVLLETSSPRSRLKRPFWLLYMAHVVPRLARLFGAPRDAYDYFQRSVLEFKSREELAEDMRSSGLVDVEIHDLALGAVCAHVGTR